MKKLAGGGDQYVNSQTIGICSVSLKLQLTEESMRERISTFKKEPRFTEIVGLMLEL